MAAGQVDVTRREEIYDSTRKRFCSKYGYRDLGLGRDNVCKVDRRNGWESGEESRTIVGGKRGKSRFGDEISRFEDEGSMPRQKRIKNSPSVWVDEEIRVLSKNRFFKKSTPGFPLQPSPKSHEKINSLIVDDVSNSPHSTIQLQGKNEDNECTGVRPISMSRWACEEDLPLQKGSSHDRSISPQERAVVDAPESGEFLGEICESNKFSDARSGSGSEQLNDEVDSGLFESCLDSEVENDKAAPGLRRVNMLQACRSVCVYEKLGRISEGTYGVVYKARDKETGEIVALKKVKMGGEREGFPLTALREINLLLALHHPSVIDVKEVVMDGNNDVYMVMEYMKYDLRKLIEIMKQPFSEKEVKCLMLQLLEGIKELHDNWILHRDLKTSNILISESGKLKICDFGMSRQYGCPLKPFTTLVVTLWYRAPELLLGAKQYSTAVDMWSVGCIMAELLAKKALFDGDNEVRQLDKIFRTLGTPTEGTWPGLADLPGAKACFAKHPRNTLRDKFPALSFKGSPVLSEQGFNLLSQLLTYNPEKRITVDAALEHDWFALESKHELLAAQESLAQKIKTLTYGY